MKIGEYKLLGELKNDDSGFAKWGFATKNKTEYFIKEFLTPVYPPDDSPIDFSQIQRKRAVCSDFEKRKRALYNRLNECDTGNIVVIKDFFRHGSKYYIVTDKIDSDKMDVSSISSSLTSYEKSVLIKVLAFNLSQLHAKGIVHGDIKPNNVIIKKTKFAYTTKLIDFDSSFLESSPPSFNELQGDMVYFAPEAFLLIANDEGTINSKVDVFALGLLFHQYYTGNLPHFDTEKYTYAFEAVLDEGEIAIDESIPENIAEQIAAMLNKDPEMRPTLNQVFAKLSQPEHVAEKPEPEVPKSPIEPAKTYKDSSTSKTSFFKRADSDDLL